MSLGKKITAEFIGTFWLVFGGCGSAVLAAAFPELGIGFQGVALAFGLTVLTMAFAIGHISGCHLNPAVSVGLMAGKRFPARELPAYVIAQVLGGIVRRRGPARDRQRESRFHVGRVRRQRLRRSLARRLLLACVFRRGGCADLHVSDDHTRCNRSARAPGIRAHRHRTCADSDSLDQHPGHQYLGESGAQHRSGAVRRRLGFAAAMAFLDRADRGSCHRRHSVSGDRGRAGKIVILAVRS